MLKNIALKSSTLKKKWIKIGVEGVWEGHQYGRFEMNQDSYDQMLENFSKLGLDIVVDYEHQTLYGDKAPAAGWIKQPDSLMVKDGELYARIEFTDTAKEHIDKKEYKYLSPTFKPDSVDPKTGANIGWTLHSVAMTNTPFLSEIDAVANSTELQKSKEDLMSKELEDKVVALTKSVDELKDENKALKEENAKHSEIAASSAVDSAIALKKIDESQKDWANSYALKDKAGFDEFVKNVKVPATKPEDNLYPNSNTSHSDGKVPELDLSNI